MLTGLVFWSAFYRHSKVTSRAMAQMEDAWALIFQPNSTFVDQNSQILLYIFNGKVTNNLQNDPSSKNRQPVS